ncbi:MAG TPA: GNAT family N-acetyltransferase [Solirubrobacteraceae bacterium]|nr:GNAT family N-acetyltransferase [Solirubrobacteraceae bacterium]
MPARAWVADVDEAAPVARLLVAFRDWYGRDWPSDNAFLASVERLMEDTRTEYLLGAPDDDSPPAGVLQLRFRFSVWTAADDCWLEDLFVLEAARGAGIGSALIELALQRARARGCRRIELDTNEANPAIALYERFGFSATYTSAPERNLFLGRLLG